MIMQALIITVGLLGLTYLVSLIPHSGGQGRKLRR